MQETWFSSFAVLQCNEIAYFTVITVIIFNDIAGYSGT